MKSYGLAALAPLATTHPSPPSPGTGDPGVPRRGMKAIATTNLPMELLQFYPKNLPEWAEEFTVLGFGTSFIKNNRFFSIIFSKITGYSDYYFSK